MTECLTSRDRKDVWDSILRIARHHDVTHNDNNRVGGVGKLEVEVLAVSLERIDINLIPLVNESSLLGNSVPVEKLAGLASRGNCTWLLVDDILVDYDVLHHYREVLVSGEANICKLVAGSIRDVNHFLLNSSTSRDNKILLYRHVFLAEGDLLVEVSILVAIVNNYELSLHTARCVEQCQLEVKGGRNISKHGILLVEQQWECIVKGEVLVTFLNFLLGRSLFLIYAEGE